MMNKLPTETRLNSYLLLQLRQRLEILGDKIHSGNDLSLREEYYQALELLKEVEKSSQVDMGIYGENLMFDSFLLWDRLNTSDKTNMERFKRAAVELSKIYSTNEVVQFLLIMFHQLMEYKT